MTDEDSPSESVEATFPPCPLIETFTRHSYALFRRNLVDLYAGVFFTLFFINEAPGITARENLSLFEHPFLYAYTYWSKFSMIFFLK